MGKYVKTLYKVTLKRERPDYRGEKFETIIFEFRSIKTAEAFERILKRARLTFEIVSPEDIRPRNEQGSMRYSSITGKKFI